MDLDRDTLERLERAALIELVLALQARLTAVEAELARLRDEPPVPPSSTRATTPPFVRPSRPARTTKPPRRKRTLQFARRRDTPTQSIEHAIDVCPDCGTTLRGGEVVRRRQVLDIPQVPVVVSEHVVRRRVCPYCGRVATPTLDLDGEVVGHHRVSAATMAYIASLRAVGRLPIRTIQWLLDAVHGLHLSVGGIVGVLQAVADRGQATLTQLQAAVRASPVVHADETGWREDGVNGYIWTFSTPALRYFHYAQSRASAEVTTVLGEAYAGTLVSDFYGAYNIHAGSHQRCWVHLLRDIQDLRDRHPDDADLATWAEAVHELYTEAKAVVAQGLSEPERGAARDRLDRALLALVQPGVEADPPLPQTTLCQRIDRFADELFEFVLYPGVPSDNNLAERSLRPLVIARKISGGTRSSQGSRVRMDLASLFGTWHAQGFNPLDACYQMLITPTP